jgi:hypothetical protein
VEDENEDGIFERESISSFVGFASRTLVSFPIMHLYY